jgi:hypothetical protein
MPQGHAHIIFLTTQYRLLFFEPGSSKTIGLPLRRTLVRSYRYGAKTLKINFDLTFPKLFVFAKNPYF